MQNLKHGETMFQETGGHFIGMHFFWWLFWLFLIVTAFATVTPVKQVTNYSRRSACCW